MATRNGCLMDNDCEGKRVLLIDDDQLVAQRECVILEEAGCEVTVASSTEEALRLAEGHFDLALVDIELNEVTDGRDLADTLRARHQLPSVFLTEHTEEPYVNRAGGEEQLGYIVKSSGPFVLIQSVKLALRLAEALRHLEESRDLYRSSADLTGDIIVRATLDGRWQFVNQEGRKVFGIDSETARDQEFWRYVHPEDLEATAEALKLLTESRKPVRGLINRQKTVRGWRTYEWNAAPIEAEGEVTGFQATGRDITEREEAHRELLLKEHALQGSAGGVAFADLQQRISYANPAILKLWNYTHHQDVVGRPVSDFLTEVDRLNMVLSRVAEGEDQVSEFTGIRGDGSSFTAELTLSGVRDDEGSLIAYMAVVVDVTERQRREAEIRDLLQQKNVLLRELRHRIKNDLNLVRSLLLLQASQTENEGTVTSLYEASDRLTVLSQVYDKVSRETGGDRVELRVLLEELVEDLRTTTLREDVTVELEVEEMTVTSRESVTLGIIVNELITNAVKYSDAAVEEPQITLTLAADAAGALNLMVRDNGPGFPEEVLNGNLRGFGFTIINELVIQHHARMSVSNDNGAVVRISGISVS
ncbi:MAG: PAS domain S-box protein [Alkalispirochaetaceae bacterium]